MNYQREFFLSSTMEKVLPAQRPAALPCGTRISTWPGAKAAVQLIYHMTGADGINMAQELFRLSVTGAPCETVLRRVQLVPVELPCQPGADDYFISKEPGLYPDLLLPLGQTDIRLMPDQYRSIWISWNLPTDTPAGEYEIHICVESPSGRLLQSGVIEPAEAETVDLSFVLSVGKSTLPVQRVYHCELFHADCLADYYGVAPWSGEHWRITENFLRAAQEHGIDELMTPVLTPAFDTAPTADRTAVQLIDVTVSGGSYSFGYEKLEKWCALCKKYGVRRLNITPWFTQWGATHTPKVLAEEDGITKQIFGWHVPASDPSYEKFLSALIPELRQRLAAYGYPDPDVTYRISDEPQKDQLASYDFARSLVKELLSGAVICDSLDSVDFCKRGECPCVPLESVDRFVAAGVKQMYCYYCVSQVQQVCNRFICMPNSRSRIMGVLLYLYREIAGFAHWGFNFYSSSYSFYRINPFSNMHADWCFPAADAYLVYPGSNGEAWSSIRAEIQDDGYYDLRAMQLLERLSSRRFVKDLIYEEAGIDRITFTNYPHSADYLLRLRERVSEEINKRL